MNRSMHARAFAHATIALLLAAAIRTLPAQAPASPSAHWGGIMLPDPANRFDIAYHAVGFTRYGKELDSTGAYRFRPYNEIPNTLGFNLVTLSLMDHGWLSDRAAGSASLLASPYARRTTFMFGYMHDGPTEFFQNKVIHQANWKERKLNEVPRDPLTDTPDNVSVADQSGVPRVVAGIGQEYFLRLSYPGRDKNGLPRVNYTPYYVGVGWQLSTVNHEAFVHVGSSVNEVEPPSWLVWPGFTIRAVGVGGNLRGGMLRAGGQFRDLTSTFFNAQLVGRLRVDVASFPVEIEFARTGAYGFFVATRDSAELELIEERGDPPNDVYSAKRGMTELFSSVRIRVGQFTFETFNDSPGGKDKGPSFGATVGFNFYSPKKNTRRTDQ